MRKRYKLLGIACIVLMLIAGILAWVAPNIREARRLSQYHEALIQQRRERFENSPTLRDCVVLLNTYYWDYHDQERALAYGRRCIDLGADKTRRGWYVHMLLADIYNRRKDSQSACHHLDIGIKEAEEHKIPEDKVKYIGPPDLMKTCRRQGPSSQGSATDRGR